MPYDSSLDKQLFTRSFETEEGSRISASVHSYNNGLLKLQVTRENKDAEGNYKFGKLGRMTKNEVQELMPLINEAIEHM